MSYSSPLLLNIPVKSSYFILFDIYFTNFNIKVNIIVLK